MTNRIDMAVLTDAELAAVTGGNAVTQPAINGLQLSFGPGPELFPTTGHSGPMPFGPGPELVPTTGHSGSIPFGPGPVIFPGAGLKSN